MMLAWRKLPQGWMLFNEHRLSNVVGVGNHWYRPWSYPLFTPAGHQVLQEFPFDHPFHNGCFVGLHPVIHKDIRHNFWTTPPQRTLQDPMLENLGRVILQPCSEFNNGVLSASAKFLFHWRGANGVVLLAEGGEYQVVTEGESNQMSIKCQFLAKQDVEIPASKFAGIGIRVAPELTQPCSARVGSLAESASPLISIPKMRKCGLLISTSIENLHGHSKPGIWLETASRSRGYGVVVHAQMPTAPWFARGYGLVLHNPIQDQGLRLNAGESFVWSVTLTAYDYASGGSVASDQDMKG